MGSQVRPVCLTRRVGGCSRALLKARARRPADYLLIDVSNSFTKLAFSSRSRVERAGKLPTPQLSEKQLRDRLSTRDVTTVVACSVVPRKNALIKRAAGSRRVIWLSPSIDLGIAIDYPNPKKIGADRLANAVAVADLYGAPAIVVDFGTAVTFDIVSEEGAYIGGVIAPGLESMTNFLYQRTALLPRISLREPTRAIGKTTEQAMRSGAIHGYRGLVREILVQIKRERFSKGKVYIVATGGYAGLLAGRIREIEAIVPQLALEGLRIVGNLNS